MRPSGSNPRLRMINIFSAVERPANRDAIQPLLSLGTWFRTPSGAALSELAEEIEQIRRYLLVDCALIRRTQRLAHVGASRALFLLLFWSQVSFGVGRLLSFAPNAGILVIIEAQNQTPTRQNAAPLPSQFSPATLHGATR